MKKKSLDWEENTWFLIEIATKMILEETIRRKIGQIFQSRFFFFPLCDVPFSPSREKNFHRWAGYLELARLYSCAVKARGGESREGFLLLEEDYWLLSVGLSRAKIRLSSPAPLVRSICVPFGSALSIRCGSRISWTTVLVHYIPSLLSLPVYSWGEFLGITLARELPPGNGRHSRFDHRSVPSPPPLSDLLLLLLLLFSKRLWDTIRKHFSNFFSRFQLINSRMDVGIQVHPSLKFLFWTILGRGKRERIGRIEKRSSIDRRFWQSVSRSNARIGVGGKVRVGSAPLTSQLAICRRQFIRAGIERLRNLRISDHGAVMRPE